ncbi:MAG: hypothetical protein GXP09_07455 [Gammaproteobacteria bacterium]|nr:hypothetical protein [Gammaproteobacteria bacterium]
MRINIMALSVTAALFWGIAIFITASANLVWPGYGSAFLELAASIYPGFNPGTGMGSVITGTLYGLVDGAICGAIFGWLYNLLARKFPGTAT